MLPDLRIDRGRGCRLSRQPHRRPVRWLRNRPISPDRRLWTGNSFRPDQPRMMDIPLLFASPITWTCRRRMVRPRAGAQICRAPLLRPAARHRGCPVLRHFVMSSPAIACRCSRRRPRSHWRNDMHAFDAPRIRGRGAFRQFPSRLSTSGSRAPVACRPYGIGRGVPLPGPGILDVSCRDE